MAYDEKIRRTIWKKTDGSCHLCHKPTNYYEYGKLGPLAWELDHLIPLARAGVDRPSNLFIAHPSCNRSKRDSTNHIRRRHGVSGIPPSTESRQRQEFWNGVAAGVISSVANHIYEKNKDKWARGLARGAFKFASRISGMHFDEAETERFMVEYEDQMARRRVGAVSTPTA